jgi:hypothetical protein
MQIATTRPAANAFRLNKLFLAAIIALFILTAGFFAFRSLGMPASRPALSPLSQNALEEKYGLRVNLIAVTAAGGMLDLRLKIVDAEKAKLLLQDKKNFPVLIAREGAVTLSASEETKSQVIDFENGSNLFVLFPNSGNAVRPGASVTLLFGETALEPLLAK